MAAIDASFAVNSILEGAIKLVKAIYNFFQFAKKAEAEIKAMRSKVASGATLTPKEQKAMAKALKKGKLIKEVTGTPMFKAYTAISKPVTV